MPPRLINCGNPVSNHPLNVGRVAWWLGLPNNSYGGKLFDLRQANDGTLNNFASPMTPTSGWIPGPALPLTDLYFDGSNDQVRVTDAALLQFGTNDVSIAFSMYITGNPGSNQAMLNKDPNGSRFFCTIQTNGTIRFGNLLSSTQSFTTGTVAANTWTRVMATRTSGGTLTLYLQGVQDSQSSGSAGDITASGTDWFFGTDSGAGQAFGGGLGDISFWNRTLSATEAFIDNDQAIHGYPDLLNRYTPAAWRGFNTAGGAVGRLFRNSILEGLGGTGQQCFNPSLSGL